MPLILQGKDFPQAVLSFQVLRYSCSLTSAYPDVFFHHFGFVFLAQNWEDQI